MNIGMLAARVYGGTIAVMVCILVVLLVAMGFFVYFGLTRPRNKMMKRAKEIDPTVTTLVEADYVLKKDMAQNVGNKQENKIFCKHCGASIDQNSKFCNKCGKEQ